MQSHYYYHYYYYYYYCCCCCCFTTIIQNNLEDFVGATFYCPPALADGNQRIPIREKTLNGFTNS